MMQQRTQVEKIAKNEHVPVARAFQGDREPRRLQGGQRCPGARSRLCHPAVQGLRPDPGCPFLLCFREYKPGKFLLVHLLQNVTRPSMM